MQKEYKINNKTWTFVKETKGMQWWNGEYYSSDGDGVSLFIEKGGFELRCFSGIPASSIFIDVVDFMVFQHEPNKIADFDVKEPYELLCIRIADYICNKFCDNGLPF